MSGVLLVDRAAALGHAHPQVPIGGQRCRHAQRRRRRVAQRVGRPDDEAQPVEAQGAGLQAAQRFLPHLRQPGDGHVAALGLEQLLGDPEPSRGLVDLVALEAIRVDPILHQPGQRRRARRTDDGDTTASGNDGPDGRRQQGKQALVSSAPGKGVATTS